MQITSCQKKLELVEWAAGIVQIAERRKDEYTASQIRHEIEEYLSGRFMLAVLGKVKRGKSTFCNAFLGRSDDLLAPVNRQPATSVFTKFFWGETESTKVFFRDGRSEKIPSHRIRDFVLEESNRQNQKQVDCIEVAGPFAGLDRDLTLVDTPGAGSIHEHHDALLLGLLPQADAAIFLVTADQPIAHDELELLQQLKAHDIKKIFFAINKVDDPNTDEAEIMEGIEHNRRILCSAGISVDKIYRISGIKAMQGQIPGSGFEELFADISEFLAQNKVKILQARFRERVISIAESMLNGLVTEIASNSKSESELSAEMANLQQQRQKLSNNQSVIEKEFLRKWAAAVDKYEAGILAAEENVKTKARKKINETGITDVGKLVRHFPRYLNDMLQTELSAAAQSFETESRDAMEKLRLDYPQIMLDRQRGEIVVRTDEANSILIKGATGGVIGVAAGAAAGFTVLSMATAATTTATVLTPVAAGLVGFLGPASGSIASIMTGLGIGTTTITTLPAWVALAGPIGWTLAGLGVLTIPFAYRSSKLKLKEQLEIACLDHIKAVFGNLKSGRIGVLRKMAEKIVEEHQTKLEHDLAQLETAIQNAIARKGSNPNAGQLEAMVAELNQSLRQK